MIQRSYVDELYFLLSPCCPLCKLEWFHVSPSLSLTPLPLVEWPVPLLVPTQPVMLWEPIALIIVWLCQYNPNIRNITHIILPNGRRFWRGGTTCFLILEPSVPGLGLTQDQAAGNVYWAELNFKRVKRVQQFDGENGRSGPLDIYMEERKTLQQVLAGYVETAWERVHLSFSNQLQLLACIPQCQKAWVFQDAFLECWASHREFKMFIGYAFWWDHCKSLNCRIWIFF